MEILNKVDLLPDPCNDRACKTVDCPPNKPISAKILYPFSGADANKPDWKLVK